jgi:hypothetical protein
MVTRLQFEAIRSLSTHVRIATRDAFDRSPDQSFRNSVMVSGVIRSHQPPAPASCASLINRINKPPPTEEEVFGESHAPATYLSFQSGLSIGCVPKVRLWQCPVARLRAQARPGDTLTRVGPWTERRTP